ncbi:MAG TPA: MipA/OmpV family protein, partial [Burkholderiales bacterium]|nr:MipA/OmpV family protein [Burkholderiales bacterium]
MPKNVNGAMRSALYSRAVALFHAVLVCAGAAACARAEQLPLWEAGMGAAALSFPDYRGSDERQFWLLPFPYLVYRGEFLQADERRMRGVFFKTERAELDLSFNGSVPVDSDDNDARRG